jgi:thiol-disulfide isomerase/thioredoxin
LEVIMTRFLNWMGAAAVVCGSLLATATAPAPARADDRSPDAILKEIDAVTLPRLDAARREDSAYIRQFITEQRNAQSRRAELIGELYRADPENPKLIRLLPERWTSLSNTAIGRNGANDLIDELNAVIAQSKNEALKKQAAIQKASIGLRTGADDAAKVKAVDEFIALYPKDPIGGSLLVSLGSFYVRGVDKKKALLERALEQYPDGRSADTARAILHRLDAVGKPFDLEFTEAITGTEISMKDLKGKVVVIDFWATWCGPCVAEMPKMKALYAEYKDKGVEFIGVSLDAPEKDGGLTKLKEFVKTQGISWPQYYQGNGWESKFSRSWGINSIPAVFLIDQDGKLASIEARGKLETMIPALLNRPAAPASVGAEGP